MGRNSRGSTFIILLVLVLSAVLGAVAGGALSPENGAIESGDVRTTGLIGSPTPTPSLQPSPTATPQPTPSLPPPVPSPTQPPVPSPTPPPAPTVTASPTAVTAVPTPMPTPTSTPEIEASPTEAPAPTETVTLVVLAYRLNLRAGPGIEYPTVGDVPAGVEAEVIGRNADGGWVLVQILDSPLSGWVNSGPEFVEFIGDLATVPVAEPE
jgi:hypothetical protein